MSGRKSVNPGTWATPSGEALREDDAARLAEEFEADDTALDGVEITYPPVSYTHLTLPTNREV